MHGAPGANFTSAQAGDNLLCKAPRSLFEFPLSNIANSRELLRRAELIFSRIRRTGRRNSLFQGATSPPSEQSNFDFQLG
jgi:hypothetical protein